MININNYLHRTRISCIFDCIRLFRFLVHQLMMVFIMANRCFQAVVKRRWRSPLRTPVPESSRHASSICCLRRNSRGTNWRHFEAILQRLFSMFINYRCFFNVNIVPNSIAPNSSYTRVEPGGRGICKVRTVDISRLYNVFFLLLKIRQLWKQIY